jgi:hypothetical protein
MPVRRFERNQQFSTESVHLGDEEMKVALKCMETTQNICCRGHTHIAHITAGIGFWTYVDWYFFAHLSEYYTSLKPITIF